MCLVHKLIKVSCEVGRCPVTIVNDITGLIFLAPPAESQRSFYNTELSVFRPSTCHLTGGLLKNGLLTFFIFDMKLP